MIDPGFLSEFHNRASDALFDAATDRWFTHAELRDHVAALANALRFPRKALGFLFLRNDADSLIAYLAAMYAGHAIVTLNPDLDARFRNNLIARFQPGFILAPHPHPDEELWMPAESSYGRVELAHNTMLRWDSAKALHRNIHPDLTLLISTSGSTGSPRLVRLSSRNLASNALQIVQALGITEQSCGMVTTPIFNAYGQSVVHSHLLAGASFVLARDRIVSAGFWKTVRDTGCDSIGGKAYFYQALDRLDLDSLAVPNLTTFVQTGGRLHEQLARKFHARLGSRGGALHIMYGQAEATARISGLPPDLLPEAARSVGFALPCGRVHVEREGRACIPMEEGEVIYEGPNVMMGYANTPADFAEGDLLQGKLATGDLGHLDDRGLLFITGRASRFVKLFGWRVNLDDVEEMLSVGEPLAVAGLSERIVVFHQGSDDIDRRVAEVAARLRLHPSGFEVRRVCHIPTLPNGKTDYRSLAA